MSIFGPPDPRGALEGALLADGSTIPTRNTKWGGRRITNLGDPSHEQDAATKSYVDRKKPVITVWAERSGQLQAGKFQWSFGDRGRSASGYTMLATGRVLRMGLASTASNAPPDTNILVYLSVHSVEQAGYSVTQRAGEFSGTAAFVPPLELAPGDVISFMTGTDNKNNTNAVVSVLIQLDI